MASIDKVTIVLGAALKTPQSVNFEDITAFTFGTIPEAVQFVPAGTEPSTGGSPATTKLTTRGKRPDVIIPNPPRVWRKKESPADVKSTSCLDKDEPRRLNAVVTKHGSQPKATTSLTGGRTGLRPIPGMKEQRQQSLITTKGRMPTKPATSESVILTAGSVSAAHVFSNPEKMRKRGRQQERKKKARQNKGQGLKPKGRTWPTKFTLADDNLFNLLKLIKKNSYTARGLKLKAENPTKQTDSHAPNPKVQKKGILKNAYDVYKAAKRSMAGRVTLTTQRGINKSQFPPYENYEIHTVRVIEESDPPPAHETAQVRDRIVTRSQSSRMTSTPRKDSLSIAAEESTSTQRGLPPAREEEPEVALQTQNILDAAGNNTNQLLVIMLNQIQTLCAQLNDINQRVTNLQDHIFRQEEPPTRLNLVTQSADIFPGSHHQLSSQQSQLVQPSALPLEQIPGSAKTQDTPLAQQSKRQGPLIPQQSSSLTNQLRGRDGYMTREEVQQLIANQLRQSEAGITRRMGRPYPAEHDTVPYPLEYIVPKFKSFNGIGNPVQHLAHFIATCGNTGSSDALLLRQFSQSLTGVAFEWYYSLENGSIHTWAEMEKAFTSKFASISDIVDITTLVNTRMKKDESPVDYITRWRNLSIRCEHSLDQTYAVDAVIANIDNWMSPFLRSNKARTFQELINQVSRLEKSKAPS